MSASPIKEIINFKIFLIFFPPLELKLKKFSHYTRFSFDKSTLSFLAMKFQYTTTLENQLKNTVMKRVWMKNPRYMILKILAISIYFNNQKQLKFIWKIHRSCLTIFNEWKRRLSWFIIISMILNFYSRLIEHKIFMIDKMCVENSFEILKSKSFQVNRKKIKIYDYYVVNFINH